MTQTKATQVETTTLDRTQRATARVEARRQAKRARWNEKCWYDELPYGMEICADGSVYLFAREYQTLWFWNAKTGKTERGDHGQDRPNVVKQVFLYNDGHDRCRNHKLWAVQLHVLTKFNVDLRMLPVPKRVGWRPERGAKYDVAVTRPFRLVRNVPRYIGE